MPTRKRPSPDDLKADPTAWWVVLQPLGPKDWDGLMTGRSLHVPLPMGRDLAESVELRELMMRTGRLILKASTNGRLAVCRPIRRNGARLRVSRPLLIDPAYRQASSRSHAERVYRPNLPPSAARLVTVLREAEPPPAKAVERA